MKTTGSNLRAAGALLALGGLVFVVGMLVHPQGEGVSTGQTETVVVENTATWVMSHWLIGIGLLLVAGGALLLLVSGTRMTAHWASAMAWTLLILVAVPMSVMLAVESTTLAEFATAGDSASFAATYAFAEGVFNLFLVAPVALLLVAWMETRAAAPVTPKWAAWVAVIGAVAGIGFFVGGVYAGISAFQPLFLGALLPFLWVAWVGVSLWTPKTSERVLHASATA